MVKVNKPKNLNKKFEFLIKSLLFTLIFSWIINYFLKFSFFPVLFAISIAVFSLLGSVYSLKRSFEWGFTNSSVGLSLLFFSLGLFSWFFGESFLIFDSVLNTSYNISDFIFIFMDPLYLLGIFFLAQAIGTFKYFQANLSLVFLPILILVLNLLTASYFQSKDFLELILNFSLEDIYILGSIILATFTISVLIFSKKLGGIYKKGLITIFIAIIFQYLGDNVFAFLPMQQLNGSLADLLFLISITLLTLGVIQLDSEKLYAK